LLPGHGRNPALIENQRGCIIKRFAPRGRLQFMIPFPFAEIFVLNVCVTMAAARHLYITNI
jgi:sugar lactone lactonase YvrE